MTPTSRTSKPCRIQVITPNAIQIETSYNSAAPAQKDAIRKRAGDLGLITGDAPADKFIKILRRSFDANDAVTTQKFKTLADFASQAP